MNCPRCGAEAQGNFCSSCGASLVPTPCPACGNEPDAGDRFCNQCGSFLEGEAKAAAGGGRAVSAERAGTGPRPGASNTGWLAAAGLLMVLILVLAWPRLQAGGTQQSGGQSAAPPLGGSGPASGPSSVDLSAMTPRQAADRLFDRVMRDVSAGNDAEVQSFLPMAVAAHERAMPLDADGMFHLGLLQLTGQDPAGALETAEAGLAEAPNHLLLLSVAAEAEKQAGNDDAAAAQYRHMLDVWDAEMASGNEDYEAHRETIREIESTARSFLEGR